MGEGRIYQFISLPNLTVYPISTVSRMGGGFAQLVIFVICPISAKGGGANLPIYFLSKLTVCPISTEGGVTHIVVLLFTLSRPGRFTR